MTNVINDNSVTLWPCIYTSLLLGVRITNSDICFIDCLTSPVVSVILSTKIEGAEKGIDPVESIFCLKERK
jgi:hypothetical protein